MLMVTDLLQVALGRRVGASVRDQAPQRFGGAAAPVVVWNVCLHCNQRCPHCYIAAGTRPAPGDLGPAEAMHLLEKLAAGGVRVVIFSGGEPLLRPDLPDLVTRAGGLGMLAQLSSNGTLIDQAMADRLCAGGLRYVGVSIDGLADVNDAYRGMEGGFERAAQGLRCARAAGMRTGLRMTLTRRNLHQVDDLLAVATSLPVDRFYLSHLVYAGRGKGMAGEDLTPAETRTSLERLFVTAEDVLQRKVPLSIVTGANDSDGVCLLLWVRRRHGEAAACAVEELLAARGGNSAGEGIISIDPDGCVHPDPFWRTVTLGDLTRDSLADVLAHPLLAQLQRRETLLQGRCGTCAWKSICRGAHRARAEAATGSIWGSDPACVLNDREIGCLAGSAS